MAIAANAQLLAKAQNCQAAGRLAEAQQLYQQILARDSRYHPALHCLGKLAHQVGRSDVALNLIAQAAAIQPTCAEYHHDVGIVLTALQRPADAEASFRRAIAVDHGYVSAHYNLGTALLARGAMDEAITAFREAVRLEPRFADAHFNLGLALMNIQQPALAVVAFRAALAINPNYLDARANLAAALIKIHNPKDAEIELRKVLAAQPKHPQALSNLSAALGAMGRYVESIEILIRSVQLFPDDPLAHHHLGMNLLLMGQFKRGWEHAEWRTRASDTPLWLRDASRRWDGSDLTGKTIVLLGEQGIGDTIQFVRYAPMVKARGGRVVLACEPAVLGLVTKVQGLDAVTSTYPKADFDVDCPLLSLPRIFGTDADTIPANVPYLAADPDVLEKWRSRLQTDERRVLRVGLVWAGQPLHANDHNRSIDPRELTPMSSLKSVRFYSLQKGSSPLQLARPAKELNVIDLGEQLETFADTAAVITLLDLVVCVDTSVAHLAGALGKPVWVLLPYCPDWRWMLDRQDSPWYPTMRLFRQDRPKDWSGPIARIVQALQTESERHASAHDLRP